MDKRSFDWPMFWVITAIGALVLTHCTPSEAGEWVTELGVGYKVAQSPIMHPDRTICGWQNEDLSISTDSCGGDNPVFIGWPLAYEWGTRRRGYTWRAGWFHFSSLLDGSNALIRFAETGDTHETHFDALAISVKFNWSIIGGR